MYLHRDADMLPGFPQAAAGDGEASPVLADLDGDNRNELVVANSDGVVHAFRRDGSELPGWPVHTDPLPLHTGGRRVPVGRRVGDTGGAVLASPAAATSTATARPRWSSPTSRARSTSSPPAATLCAARDRTSSTPASRWSRSRTCATCANPDESKRNRTQHGFLGSPVLADLDGNDGGRLEIVAAAMDRHVYAWNHDGSDVPGWPVLVVDPSKVASIDPVTHQVTFNRTPARR